MHVPAMHHIRKQHGGEKHTAAQQDAAHRGRAPLRCHDGVQIFPVKLRVVSHLD